MVKFLHQELDPAVDVMLIIILWSVNIDLLAVKFIMYW